jgi:hypothetical protein
MANMRLFRDGQALGGNGKLLGHCTRWEALAGEYENRVLSI